MYREDEISNYWIIMFEGLVLNPRLQSVEGEFEILDALDEHNIVVLEWVQSEAKFKFWRVSVCLKVYRESPVHKSVLREILKEFDILSLRIKKEKQVCS